MVYLTKSFDSKIVEILLRGGVGVIPTDTLYGIVGSALNKKTIGRIYKLRRRNSRKPMIILVGSASDLEKFDVKLGARERKILNHFWPGKVSVILRCPSRKFRYLHRGTKTLAFRLPGSYRLIKLLANVGPLVAPSTNWEGNNPALTIREARRSFGKNIDFYLDAGRRISKPSTLAAIRDGRLNVLREGAVKVK